LAFTNSSNMDRKKKSKNPWLKIAKNFKFLPPATFVKIAYEAKMGTPLDLKNPLTFNEKIQWYKVYYKNPVLNTVTNKYLVRDFVKEKIGEEYLNELLGVFNHPDEIDFDALPNQFALKVAHGSGYNIIVPDKSKLDVSAAKKKLRKWQKTNFYKKHMEWAYKDSKPYIIAEKFLEESGQQVINDYKFFCFDGEIKFIQVDLERKIHDYRCFYDTDWNKQEFCNIENPIYPGDVPRPENLDEMIQIARKLSEGLPFVRVDLYSIKGKTYFGEMTFYPANGTKLLAPAKWNRIVGDYFKLPKV
jgi:hypothetical protein